MFEHLKQNTEVNFEPTPSKSMMTHIEENTLANEQEMESTQPLPGADLPAWKCHKIVHAAKIVSIEYVAPRDDSAFAKHALYLDFGIEWGVTPVIVDPEWFAKHSPDEGGYLVVYEDGYQSYSPAEPFESGYTLLEKAILAEENSKCGCDNPPKSLPLYEAESLLAWLMTQPSTPENKALRAQAGIVVDYLKPKDAPKESKLSAAVKSARGGDAPVQFKGYA